jgi:hypothetical protein
MLSRPYNSKLWPDAMQNAENLPCQLVSSAAHHGQTVRQLLISTVSEC